MFAVQSFSGTMNRALGIAILGAVLAGVHGTESQVRAQESPAPVQIQRESPPFFKGGPAGFIVIGFSQGNIKDIQSIAEQAGLKSLLQVFVSGSNTPMLGDVALNDGQLIFTPRFALNPGVKYKVRFGVNQISQFSSRKPIFREFTIEKDRLAESAKLVNVYPTAARLPQNILKMYLYFSRPMSRGEAYEHIRFYDGQGKQILDPFIRLDQELWSTDGKRFTLLFDPGRIKRELKPNRELGPPFQPGREYKMVVDANWTDAQGNRLRQSFKKKFFVTEADRKQPDHRRWKIKLPRPESRDRLRLIFDESLDRAMLDHAVTVVDANDTSIDLRQIEIGERELVWSILPANPWKTGTYIIKISPKLEDLAGNSLEKPFEREMKNPQSPASTEKYQMKFEIR